MTVFQLFRRWLRAQRDNFNVELQILASQRSGYRQQQQRDASPNFGGFLPVPGPDPGSRARKRTPTCGSSTPVNTSFRERAETRVFVVTGRTRR